MGVKGKLIALVEVKCGGHPILDFFHIHTHHIPNISPNIINHLEIHAGETVKVGSIVSCNYNEGSTYFSILSPSIRFTYINFLYLGVF